MEHTGGDAARPFVERARTTFPTVVDEHGVTSTLLGFKAVPNGVLVDGDGVLRWAKYGGFSIDKPEDVAVVERFLGGGDPGPSPVQATPYTLGPVERELVDTKLRLGRLLESLNRRDEAVTEWRAALRLDPENLVIRKQIWAARHPERFHPTIDWDWQRERLKREREDEIAAGICGPDGCPVPWA
ncbi:MAG: hypothetical protein AVDCRST_MAG73-3014 [uncultured Thermomicrobiales bacterium]|uniref:Uncharacterized protein n=1 Tax=uncultured Thermomicrobiales bacterium TaxID=1645740 RepID=A0A6J4UKK5_9BACT|nr:MAG: hypothetical protein AVDCRST_MAG73-3014 [uncultured Thermomicrobiales bacterium]